MLSQRRSSSSSRREFLRWTASAALTAALCKKADAAREGSEGDWRNRNSEMAYRRLGRTGYMVSEVVCGGNFIAPDNFRHVEMAIEMGLNYLDTAPQYGRGRSEEGYSRVVQGAKREKVFLNTKVSLWVGNRNKLYQQIFERLSDAEQKKIRHRVQEEIEKSRAAEPDYLCHYNRGQQKRLEESVLSNVMEPRYGAQVDRRQQYRELILQSVEESLRRLKTDYLDLLMCPHGANSYDEVTRFPEIFEAFETLRKAGKVRHLAVSSHSDPGGVLRGVLDAEVYSAAMIAYNIVNHRYIDDTLHRAHREQVGVIAMKVARPVHHGRNNGQPNDPRRVALIEEAMPGPLKLPQKCYLWALQNPWIAAVNSEMISAGMVKENLPLARRKA